MTNLTHKLSKYVYIIQGHIKQLNSKSTGNKVKNNTLVPHSALPCRMWSDYSAHGSWKTFTNIETEKRSKCTSSSNASWQRPEHSQVVHVSLVNESTLHHWCSTNASARYNDPLFELIQTALPFLACILNAFWMLGEVQVKLTWCTWRPYTLYQW